MEINKEIKGSEITFFVKGRLNTVTSSTFEEEVKQNIVGKSLVIFDFTNLSYISSAGLRIILVTQKTMKSQGKFIIRNVNDNILDLFEMTGFRDILCIE